MELRQIKYFVAVSEECHFGRAAHKIGIAQPALSQQIKRLEQELGGALFTRTKRHVAITDAGKVFLTEAKALLTQAERAKKAVGNAFKGNVGELVLEFVESATWKIIPEMLAIYRKLYPNVKVILQPLHTINQVDAIKNGKIQVGILGTPIEDPLLFNYLLRKESYVVALPVHHSLASKTEIFANDLRNEAFVTTLRETGTFYYDSMIKVCMDAGFSPRIIQEARDMQTVLALVSSGLGIALIHESARHIRNDVVYKPLIGTCQKAYQMSFAWRKEADSPVVINFLKVIKHLYPTLN
ncbi:LysR substrate-binding domain-containing protein [Sporolactobacillus shoreicorticis]|uniref:LysR substrate-binding domain-containing protein n=1 Tax=Sporolactobacillus shoreicorticis TaxID=1923877 RepID=A0ABW5S170_9BACL|nr:LysR substrate-binding domain-containing protein [Sporolactobacillus shoreicorticis]MCO7124761.1 LysR substrate-binding domain-containing protein [Sporolactobacillus shoreicorticis]